MVSGWTEPVTRIVGGLDNAVSVAWLRLKLQRGWLDRVSLLPYRGYGTADRWHLKGRVLEQRGLTRSSETDPVWRNVAAAARRFASSEVPGAVVQAHHGGRTVEAVADVEGYFSFDLPAIEGDGWQQVGLELVGPLAKGQEAERATGQVLIPPENAEFGVISDLDDTVLRSRITEGFSAVQLVLLHNAHTRLPFPGVSAFYRALHRGSDGGHANPVFYVSGSPWNLYDMLVEFLGIHGVPKGPLFLKDWGVDEDKWWKRDTKVYKLEHITRLLDAYPDLGFVLIGDSGQHDPEIYRDAVVSHPGRVRAVYVRDVTSAERHEQVLAIGEDLRDHGVPLVLSQNTVAAARHAADLGLIEGAAVDTVRRGRGHDDPRHHTSDAPTGRV